MRTCVWIGVFALMGAAVAAEAARLLIRAKAGDEDLPPSVTIPFDFTVRRSTKAD